MERKTVTIEEIVAIAKQRTSVPEEQAKYIQIGIDLIERDHPDEFKKFPASKSGYDYQISAFADGGGAYFWHNIYKGASKVASVLEVYRTDSKIFEVLFSSSSVFTEPIMPHLME